MFQSLKTYPAPWHGRILLACKKCQKKLKGHKHLNALAKLRKTAKQQGREHPGKALHVINVPCMDLCPKNGVTVCDPARNFESLIILRDAEDLRSLAPEPR